MGIREHVFHECGTAINCSYYDGKVGWYYSENYSWGFVNGSDSVYRSTCDTDHSSTGLVNPGYRLCWHTGPTYGGFRCGTYLNLNNDHNFVRYIYHID